MGTEETDSSLGRELNESECYAFKIGFNAAIVTTVADSLSDNDGMRVDTLMEALAAEFAKQFRDFDDTAEIIDDFLLSIVERIVDHLGESDPSEPAFAVTAFDLTSEYAPGRKGCRGCSCGCDGD